MLKATGCVLGMAICLMGQVLKAVEPPPKVTLRGEATIKAGPPNVASPQEEAGIKELIHSLAKIDHPDFGISATFSGTSFAAITNSGKIQGLILTPGYVNTFPGVVELVQLGPKAIPFLLESLGDQTPTKLIIKRFKSTGGIWFANELEGNPARKNEQKVIDSRPRLDAWPDHFGSDHPEEVVSNAVTVGDVCFVIIGQIVNRPYEAARYQMTACIVLNSPTHDPILAEEVRNIWSAPNSVQDVANSLLIDFETDAIHYPTEHYMPSRWILPSDLQTGAAMRLLYYFPQQSASFIAKRLKELDRTHAFKNSGKPVSTADMIEAVGWSDNPIIQATIKRIFKYTTDADTLLASADSVGQSNTVELRNRMETLLANLPKTEKSSYGQGYTLLYELAKQFGPDAKPVFARYMHNASSQRCLTLCEVLESIEGNWTIELLTPLLNDKSLITYDEADMQAWAPRRVCDEAASVIAQKSKK